MFLRCHQGVAVWVALAWGCTSSSSPSTSTPGPAKFIEVQGSVQVGSHSASAHEAIPLNATVVVDAGLAVITFAGATLRIYALSRVRLGLEPDSRVFVEQGSLWLERPRDSRTPLVVQTASARIAIVGTELAVRVEGDTTHVGVIRGEVQVTGADGLGQLRLGPGRQTTVKGVTPPEEPAPYDNRHAHAWAQLRAWLQEVDTQARKAADALRRGVQEQTPRVRRSVRQGTKKLRRELDRWLGDPPEAEESLRPATSE